MNYIIAGKMIKTEPIKIIGKDTYVQNYIEECLQKAKDKIINEQIGDIFDTYGMRYKRWIEKSHQFTD